MMMKNQEASEVPADPAHLFAFRDRNKPAALQ